MEMPVPGGIIMSGGYFTHRWALADMAEEIDKCVLTNKIPNEWDEVRDYPDEVLQKFSEVADDLRRLSHQVYLIDYLLSGDIGPETLLKKWSEIE
jgi:hypothetical protein